MGAKVSTTRFVAVLAGMALLIAACSDDDEGDAGNEPATTTGAGSEAPASGAPAGDGGGAFTMYSAEPDTLYPPEINSGQAQRVLTGVYSGLVTYELDGETTWGPDSGRAMAESIESDDQRVWTITLKDGWTFHDGEPVTAESFVNAWNWTAYQPNGFPNSDPFAPIAGFEDLQCPDDECAQQPAATEMSGVVAVDDLTIEVTLSEPLSFFPSMIGTFAWWPLHSSAVSEAGDLDRARVAPIGNGPYAVEGEWQPNQQIELVKYADYAGTPGNADAITIKLYTDNATAYNDVLAGELDILDELPTAQIPNVESEFGDNTVEILTGQFRYIGLPLDDERYQNVDLRRALSMAIDRDAIVERILLDTAVPARNVIPPTVDGNRWEENPCGEWCEYDPDAARELFDSVGFEGTLEIWYDAGRGWDEWLEAVANMWRTNLGITDIEFNPLDVADYFAAIPASEATGPFRMGFSGQWPGAYDYLVQFTTEGRLNFGHWENAEYDELVEESRIENDAEARLGLQQDAEDLLLDDMPFIPQ
ncbi:MAG TPA: ABC transporter substrate-binding protein, partial [Acidimicrobiales bacterium]|nr:ABC transporter substrate-binding protein [Acidimicrobiales bacterium]